MNAFAWIRGEALASLAGHTIGSAEATGARTKIMLGMGRHLCVVWLALVVLGAGLVPGVAESSIKVLVNDEPITTYDIAQRARLMLVAGEKGGDKAAVEQLIDEALELQEAKRRGLTIPDGAVDGAFASIARNLKLSADQFVKALASRGVDAATLKKRLKAQLAWQELLKARVRRQTSVKPSEVTAALLAEGSPEKITVAELTLQQILFVVAKGSSAAYIGQRHREAEAYRGRFTGCDHSIDLAKNLHDVAVRDLGRRSAEELTGPRGEQVKATAVGKTTPPAQVDAGIELIAVCASRDVQSNAAARAQVEDKLTIAQAKDTDKQYLKELHDKAIIENR